MDRFLLLSALLDTYSCVRLGHYSDLCVKRNETFSIPINMDMIYYSLHEHKANFSNKSLIEKALKKETLVTRRYSKYYKKWVYSVNPVELTKEIEKLYSERKDRYTTPIHDRLHHRIFTLKPLFVYRNFGGCCVNILPFTKQGTNLSEYEVFLFEYGNYIAQALGVPLEFFADKNSIPRITQEQMDREEKFKEFVRTTQNNIVFSMFPRRKVSLVSYYEANMNKYKRGKLPRNKGKNSDSFITACLIQKKRKG